MTPNKKLYSAEDAIKQAIKGGWDIRKDFDIPQDLQFNHGLEKMASTVMLEKTLTSPLFWQALGKARGWGAGMFYRIDIGDSTLETDKTRLYSVIKNYGKRMDMWEWYAIKWFEIRLSNGDETNFWKELP